MQRFDLRIVMGVLLIASGVLFLLQNMGYITSGLGLLWALLMALVGAAFLATFFGNRLMWWTLIPGLIFIDLAALIMLSELWPAFAERWGGAFFLAGLSLPFWVVYLANRAYWWGIIPGGVLLTLAVVAGVSDFLEGGASGGIFFGGLGLTFLALFFAPTPQGRLRWAIWPAVPLLAIGVLAATTFATMINYVVPVALLLGGLFLVVRSLRPRTG